MSELMYWGGRISVAVSATMLMWALLGFTRDAPPLDPTAVRRRRDAFAKRPLLRFIWPVVRAASGVVARFELRQMRPRLDAVLKHASRPLGMVADELLAVQCLLAIALPVAFGWLSAMTLGRVHPLVLLAGPIAFMMPASRLREQVRKRTEEIERRLPYALDLIIVCVEAGVGLEDAVERMIDASEPGHPLTEEFRLLRSELEFFDVPRALARMAERVPSDDLDRLVDAIIEGERQGTPYQHVLIAARDMIRRRQSTRIEKQASRAPTLMLVPTLFIFLAVLLILVGGMILKAKQQQGF